VRLRRHSNSIPQTGFLIAFGLAGGCHSCRRRRGQALPRTHHCPLRRIFLFSRVSGDVGNAICQNISASGRLLVLAVFGIVLVATVWDHWCNDDSRPIDTSPADLKKSHVSPRARDADQPGVHILRALQFCLAYCRPVRTPSLKLTIGTVRLTVGLASRCRRLGFAVWPLSEACLQHLAGQ
jgi:hypothetical protein